MQVPPDAVEPLFKQIVNQFVHDRSRPEVLFDHLNTVILYVTYFYDKLYITWLYVARLLLLD